MSGIGSRAQRFKPKDLWLSAEFFHASLCAGAPTYNNIVGNLPAERSLPARPRTIPHRDLRKCRTVIYV